MPGFFGGRYAMVPLGFSYLSSHSLATLAEQLDEIGIGNGRVATKDRNGAAVDQNSSGRVAAGPDVVAGAVTKHRQHAGAG